MHLEGLARRSGARLEFRHVSELLAGDERREEAP
jgi:hypothetical protein